MRVSPSRFWRVRGGPLALLAACAGTFGLAGHARALPVAPSLFCKEYASAPACSGAVVPCTFCHVAIDPPSWNMFGLDVQNAIYEATDSNPGLSFETSLGQALATIAERDSDGDGLTNLEEIQGGTLPGDPQSGPGQSHPDAGVAPAANNDSFDVGHYDPAFAYRRVSTLYCGRSPSYDEMTAFRSAGTVDAQRKVIHETLDRCLASDYWLKNALLRLADKRIKPQASIGPDTQIRLGPLRLVIGDYYYDFRLWRWAMSENRDMRDLLTANYHVIEGADGALSITRDVIANPDRSRLGGGQPIAPERRAGMITTQWFLALNTMFSALPRTSAAQAYRAYLGADISASEGLIPVPNEPSDIDQKGVKEARCAGCHSTLDPLAYAFAKYEGIDTMYGLSLGNYKPSRPVELIPGWDDAKQKPYLLGKPVADLVEWASVAANSDEFKRHQAETFFIHALGRKPQPADQAEFNALWRAIPADGYSANRLIHRLVDTLSFGAP